MKKIGDWADEIIKYFWYCCSVASEYNEKDALQVLKVWKLICFE